jgi:hypothetical protein
MTNINNTHASTVAASSLNNMTYDEWVNNFMPIQNPNDPDAQIDGYMFDYIDEELAFVKAVDSKFVWTVVECDSEESDVDDVEVDFSHCLLAGRHYVNRMGYIIATRPWNGPDGFEVKVEF